MKIYPFLILVSLILYIQNQCEKENEINAKKDDCLKRQLSEDEKKKGEKYCCYAQLKTEGLTFGICGGVTEEEYKDRDKHKKELEEEFDGTIESFECNTKSSDSKSLYLKLGAIALIFLLF